MLIFLLELGRIMLNLMEVLKAEKIQDIRLRLPLCLQKSTPLKTVVERMQTEHKGYAIVLNGSEIVGLFTERDLLTRVILQQVSFETPIEKLMTPHPKTLSMSHSIADAIKMMNEGGYRHLPLLNEKGEAEGMVSVNDLLLFLSEHFPYEIYNLPPDPDQKMQAAEGA